MERLGAELNHGTLLWVLRRPALHYASDESFTVVIIIKVAFHLSVDRIVLGDYISCCFGEGTRRLGGRDRMFPEATALH
eukprot:5851961-Pleurochrysis_carterae.AAC.2